MILAIESGLKATVVPVTSPLHHVIQSWVPVYTVASDSIIIVATIIIIIVKMLVSHILRNGEAASRIAKPTSNYFGNSHY